MTNTALKRDPRSSKCNVILVVMWEGAAIPKGSLFLKEKVDGMTGSFLSISLGTATIWYWPFFEIV